MTIKPEKILYTAHATSTGGREGTSKSDDGVLDLKLTTPKGLGGNGARRHQPRAAVRRRLLGLLHRRDEARRRHAEDHAAGQHLDQRRRRHRPDPARLRHPGLAARCTSPTWTRRRRRRSSRPRTRSARTRTPPAATSRSRSTWSERRRAAAAADARLQQLQQQLDPRLHRRERRRPRRAPTARPSLPRRRRGSGRSAAPATPRRHAPARSAASSSRCTRAVAGGGDDEAVDAGVDQRARPARPSAPAALVDDLDPRPGRAGAGRQRRGPSALAGAARRAAAQPPVLDARRAARRRRSANASSRVRVDLAHVARRMHACRRRPRPRRARPARAATAIASARFCGPSASREVAGRIAAGQHHRLGRREHARAGSTPSPRACRCRG